jgi:hypothetical protein
LKNGLKSEIYPKINCKKCLPIFSTVWKFVSDSNFSLVYQEPNLDKYKTDLSSFFSIRISNFDSINKFYWENYSDSINYKIIVGVVGRESYLKNNSDYLNRVRNVVDSLLANNPFHKKVFENKFNFWIIDLRNDSLHGPFQKQEYLAQKEKLGVSKTLKLDEE